MYTALRATAKTLVEYLKQSFKADPNLGPSFSGGTMVVSLNTPQEMAEQIQTYLREKMPGWKTQYSGVEEMKLAVMGCVVNGPGESKHANIGISLPGTFEEPKAPVFVDGRLMTTLKGDHIVAEFIKILDEYVDSHYSAKERQPETASV